MDIIGDDAAGAELVDCVLRYGKSFFDSRLDDLESFGVPSGISAAWFRNRDEGLDEEIDWSACVFNKSAALDAVLNELSKGQDRLSPDGVTLLGRYIAGIRERLHRNHPDGGTIIDFGCGSCPDATAILAYGGNFTVQLVDVRPLSLLYSSYQLSRRGIPNKPTLVSRGSELDLLSDDVVMFVESTAFEHVKHIRHLFVPLLEMLPENGLFLSNYTRLDWTNPKFDGYPESHEYATTAVEDAKKHANRLQLSPEQGDGEGWDLWEKFAAS